MHRKFLPIAVILTAASGCDNVHWTGFDVQLSPPPPRAELTAEAPGLAASLAEPEVPKPELPAGPVLLAGTRSGSQATLRVVGEVRGNSLTELPDEATSPGFLEYFSQERLVGSRWTLFAEGVRVGSLTASEVGVDNAFCVPRATVTGTVELVPSAASATRLMALPADAAAERSYGAYATHQHDYDQRVGSLALATAEIPRVGAMWPPDGVLSARADIQAYRLTGAPAQDIAATFLFRDRLEISPAQAGAYSLFVLGTLNGDDYRPAYSWYRPVDAAGKGAPRYFGHLDWNGDGAEEILLDVYGAESRWFAGLSRTGNSWSRTFEDSCGQTSSND